MASIDFPSRTKNDIRLNLEVLTVFSKRFENVIRPAVWKYKSCYVNVFFPQPPRELIRVTSGECSQIQRDEMTALKAIFEEDLALDDEDTKCFKITITDKSMALEEDELLDLWFR